jgi:aryl-alcohol dehydrogenase-like predicted oxidoreductase
MGLCGFGALWKHEQLLACDAGGLIEAGKIRGWGLCNDNAYGLAGCCAAAKALGVPPPVSMQNDFR